MGLSLWSNLNARRSRPSPAQSGYAPLTWRRFRKGVASVLAMLYLIIFSTLAVGFYTAVTTSVQLAHNDERSMNALVSADAGMQFMRYQLSLARIPGGTPNDKMLEELFKALLASKALQPQSENMNGHVIAMVGDTVYVPASTDGYLIPLDNDGAGFRATIVDVGDGSVLVKTVGHYRGVSIVRAIEIGFVSVLTQTNIFDYGIVARGPIDMNGGPSITSPIDPSHASVLSTFPSPTQATLSGHPVIGGNLDLVDKNGSVSLGSGASVGGSSISSIRDEHVRRGVTEPPFPTVDTTVFKQYATNPYRPNQSVYTNVVVPAGTNPSFSSNTTIEGVLYIKNPNNVKFTGQVTIRGVIVVENGASPGPSNQMTFSGGVDVYGLDTLPPSDKRFPAGLRALQGSALLAPGYAVTMSGNSGVVGGTMVADSFRLTGGAGGRIEGTILALGTAPFQLSGGAAISRSPGKVALPAGLLLPLTFKPVPHTYLEVHP